MQKPKYVYPPAIPIHNRQWPDRQITQAPRWCSVDLRDGNQSLPVPMNPNTKLDFFKMLIDIGFKEIEVAFPSASQDDFDFVRTLIEGNFIPDDVTISVLTQARKNLIDRTIESLKGVKKAILHLYVATSDLHGKMVFNRGRQDVKKMAVDGTIWIREGIEKAGLTSNVGYEFSPEEFTDTDLDFVVDLCEAVKLAWGESTKESFVLNLPATVERRPPNQYADMIEYFCTHYKYMASTSISLHAHNDQGCAVAATELALLAGADRVEGTLFGHGERTGNLCLVTLAMNLFSRGIDSKLNFSNMAEIVKRVEEHSNIEVHPRHPYAGQLVFTAFSGSHQDAIRKGLELRHEAEKIFGQTWKVPYLHVDPQDVGRVYEKLIRINSQSGKGGVAFVLESEYGIYAPKQMHVEIGLAVQLFAEEKGDEVSSPELFEVFKKTFVEQVSPYEFVSLSRLTSVEHPDQIGVRVEAKVDGNPIQLVGWGNGPIAAAASALNQCDQFINFEIEDFAEHTLGKTSDAHAIAYVGIAAPENQKDLCYGCGLDTNIDRASIKAIFSALNRLKMKENQK